MYFKGGVDVGDVDQKARVVKIPVQSDEAAMVPSADELRVLVGDLGSRTELYIIF